MGEVSTRYIAMSVVSGSQHETGYFFLRSSNFDFHKFLLAHRSLISKSIMLVIITPIEICI